MWTGLSKEVERGVSRPSVDVSSRLVLGSAVAETKVMVAKDVDSQLEVSVVPVGESRVCVGTNANVRSEEDVLDVDKVVIDDIKSL